jgi:flagellar L-ring protein precursor FlgH
MKKFFVLMLIAVWASNVSAVKVHSLYTDRRAMRQGDLLTVLVYEKAEAGSKSSTDTRKSNRFRVNNSAGVGSLRVIPGFGAGGEISADYNGSGGTTRDGRLVAKITANIDEVLDNGNLIINGNKVVMVNEEREIINISGIVRPHDIESDNTIASHKIANAEITYSGKGSAASAQRPGPFARLFNWLF